MVDKFKWSGGLRSANDEPLVEYVVDRYGRIKTSRFHVNVSNPDLDVEIRFDPSGARAVAIGEVGLSRAARRNGKALLHDLYKAEKRMADWEVWLDYQRAFREGKDVGVFPDEYLPAEVLRRRKGAKDLDKWTPPTPATKASGGDEDGKKAKAGK